MRDHAVMAALLSYLSSLHWYSSSLFVLMGGVITEATGMRPYFIVCGEPAGSCPLVGRKRNT